MVGRQRSSLSVVHQCRLLGISRSSVYYRPVGASQEDLELMREIDRQYMLTPFYGSRRIVAWLKTQGYQVNRKRVQRLMRTCAFRLPTVQLDGRYLGGPCGIRRVRIQSRWPVPAFETHDRGVANGRCCRTPRLVHGSPRLSVFVSEASS